MKQRMYVFFTLLVVILLVACGSNDASTNEGSNVDEKTEKAVLRVVTDATYAPMEFMDKEEESGFGIDFIHAVAEEAGYEIEVEHVGWDPLFIEVESGRAQLGVSSVSITDDRKEKYDFSIPYYISTNKILVPKDSSIKSSADLKGKKVAVLIGSTGMVAAEKVVGKNNKDIKKFETTVLAIMDMKKGGADAVVADNGVVEEYAKNNPKDKFVVVKDPNAFDNEYYGLMFPKDSKDRATVDKALNEIIENGTYTEIYKKWFGIDPDLETLKAQQSK